MVCNACFMANGRVSRLLSSVMMAASCARPSRPVAATRPNSARTAPGLPEAILFESRRHGGFCHPGVVAFLGFDRRDVADRLQQPAIVEPVDPSERCEFDGFHGPP